MIAKSNVLDLALQKQTTPSIANVRIGKAIIKPRISKPHKAREGLEYEQRWT